MPPKLCGADFKKFIKKVRFPFTDPSAAIAYHDVHSQRYASTANAIAKIPHFPGMKVLELAASPYAMTAFIAYSMNVDLTLATYADPANERFLDLGVDGRNYKLKEYGFNVEQDHWPLPAAAFDLVIACEIVEHLAMDPMALFAGANQVIRPGGYFFISTPNAGSLQNFLKLARLRPAGIAQQFRRPCSTARLYERHNREYTPFTLGEMLSSAGFEIFTMETDSSFPVADMGFSQIDIDNILSIITMPELRRDTIHIIGRKIGPVANRFPTVDQLYVAEDDTYQIPSQSSPLRHQQ